MHADHPAAADNPAIADHPGTSEARQPLGYARRRERLVTRGWSVLVWVGLSGVLCAYGGLAVRSASLIGEARRERLKQERLAELHRTPMPTTSTGTMPEGSTSTAPPRSGR